MQAPAADAVQSRATTLVGSTDIAAILSTMSQQTEYARLDDADYDARTARVFAAVEATLDRWLQEDVIDIDTHRTGGLLELEFPGGSKIVLNTQPPLQEIWLAARSGGLHFRCIEGRWLDTKGRREFFAALSEAASEQAGRALRFPPVD
jgi:CyaY protein